MPNLTHLSKLIHQLYEEYRALLNTVQECQAVLVQDTLPAPEQLSALFDRQHKRQQSADCIQQQINGWLAEHHLAWADIRDEHIRQIVGDCQHILDQLKQAQGELASLLHQRMGAVTSSMQYIRRHKQALNSYYGQHAASQIAYYLDEKN